MRISPSQVYFAGVLLATGSLSLGRAALISVGVMLILLAVVWQSLSAPALLRQAVAQFRTEKSFQWAAWLSAPFWFTVCSVFQTQDMAAWQADVVLKLPFLVLPLAILVSPRLSAKQYWVLCLVFVAIQTAVAVPTVIRYALHFEEVQDAISRNKSIDIITKVSHIYFGFMLAFSGILGIDMGTRATHFFHAKERYLYWALAAINLLCMHILTSRTGLIGLYAGVLTYAFVLAWKKKALLKGLQVLALLAVLPMLAYAIVPSFRQRIDSTWFDVQSYRNNGAGVAQMSDLSIGARFVAWEAAWDVFKRNPVVGTGIADMHADLYAYYATQPRLSSDTKLPQTPHNQYLVYLCTAGLVGFCVWLWVFFFPFGRMKGSRSVLFWAFMALIATAMLTESLLERQIGMSFFLLWAMLLHTQADTLKSLSPAKD